MGATVTSVGVEALAGLRSMQAASFECVQASPLALRAVSRLTQLTAVEVSPVQHLHRGRQVAGSPPPVELGAVVTAPRLALVMQFPGTTLPPQLLESLGRLPMLEVLNLSNYEPQNMMRTERIILFDDLKALARCLNLKRLDLSNLVLPFCMVRLGRCICHRVLSRMMSQPALQLGGGLRTRVLGRLPDAHVSTLAGGRPAGQNCRQGQDVQAKAQLHSAGGAVPVWLSDRPHAHGPPESHLPAGALPSESAPHPAEQHMGVGRKCACLTPCARCIFLPQCKRGRFAMS